MIFSRQYKIAVIGSGSWGSALALLLSKKGYDVHLWARRNKQVELLQQRSENIGYLDNHLFPENTVFSSSLRETVTEADLVLMVVPSHGFREVFLQLCEYLKEGVRIVSAVKGIENSSLKTMSQIVQEVMEKSNMLSPDLYQMGVISGPSFAQEVAQETPTAVTVGFSQNSVAEEIQAVFATEYFRVYASTDVIGLEMSASLKNIIAIAAGVCDGLGYGLNTRAALITRGLAEMTRFGVAFGADRETFSGLSGMGDLILTCTGSLSRNRTVGIKLGRGKSLAEIQKEMNHVAEGVKTTKSVYKLAKSRDIEMPILEQVYKILYENKDCSLAVSNLLTRDMKKESES